MTTATESGTPTGSESTSESTSEAPLRFATFREFYAHYLTLHRCWRCRLSHVVGTVLFVVSLMVAGYFAVLLHMPLTATFIASGVFVGYGFAWLGHFVFEKNRPATFGNPLYALIADFRMTGEILAGVRPLREDAR